MGDKKNAENKGVALPDFVTKRVAAFEAAVAARAAERANAESRPISITLPDGAVVNGVAGETTPLDVARGISAGLASSVVIAKVNGTLWDGERPLEGDCSLELLKFDSPEGQHVFWHSSAHLLGQALELLLGAKLCIGPPLDDQGGFYYDCALDDGRAIVPDDCTAIKAMVQKIVKEKQPFVRVELTKQEALDMFAENKYKQEIINKKVPDGERCTAYRCGPLVDLCRGPHVPTTGKIKAFEVVKNSSAYWLGNAENDALQRVYGISFPDKKQMAEWKRIREEAAKRDHRLVGKNQELFFFHPLSPGSAFFLPHGTRIYNKLVQYMREQYWARGYDEVISPNIYNHDLWKTSGHLANYKENIFSFQTSEKEDFALKPMNCPGHCLLFGMRQRSYRELPMRLADFGVLHRNEATGALSGLTRVRRFQQDDAHIFCHTEHIEAEINGVVEFIEAVYGVFGFDFDLELSTRPEKFLGEISVWNDAEASLKRCLDAYSARSGKKWELNEGDGAFYGPKIDITIRDALRRKFQCATVQLDFQLPLRFGLEFRDNESNLTTPVIIHRAILGSVERFMGILVEHTAGKWPFWISPRQAMIVPVSEKFLAYAEEVRAAIHEDGVYVDVDASDNTLNKKVRAAQLAQYNFILVVGEKEEQSKTVNVRTRDNQVHGERTVDKLREEFRELVAKHQ